MSKNDLSPQAELEQLKREVATAHEQFDLFFNHFLDAILVVDASSGCITKANDSAVRFFLYPRDELLCSDFHVLFPKEQETEEGQLVGNLRVHGHAFHEQAFLRGDGKIVVADLSAAMVMWQGHESILIILRDASERKRFEERLLQAEEAEARLAVVAQLSHEINNPLQALLTRVELDGDTQYREPVMRIANVLRQLRVGEPGGKAGTRPGLAAEPDVLDSLEPCEKNAVLIVDDEPSIRGLIQKVVKRGLPMVTIDVGASGLEALELFKEGHHELIIMDVSMPEMSGDAAFLHIMELCQQREWAPPSVVFCTGYNTPATVRATVESNPKHLCLLKPVDMGHIIDAVRERITG